MMHAFPSQNNFIIMYSHSKQNHVYSEHLESALSSCISAMLFVSVLVLEFQSIFWSCSSIFSFYLMFYLISCHFALVVLDQIPILLEKLLSSLGLSIRSSSLEPLWNQQSCLYILHTFKIEIVLNGGPTVVYGLQSWSKRLLCSNFSMTIIPCQLYTPKCQEYFLVYQYLYRAEAGNTKQFLSPYWQ